MVSTFTVGDRLEWLHNFLCLGFTKLNVVFCSFFTIFFVQISSTTIRVNDIWEDDLLSFFIFGVLFLQYIDQVLLVCLVTVRIQRSTYTLVLDMDRL